METTTIRTSEPSELLALVPFQLGFEPHESAVVVSIRSGRGRVGLVARVDLVDLADEERGPQLARSLVSHLVGDGARSAVLVLYTQDDLQDGDGGSSAARARAHVSTAAEYFLGEVDCWVVGPHGYYRAGCADRACCPTGGRPHQDLQGTEVGAQMVLGGAQVVGSRAELVPLQPATGAARRSARLAASRWSARLRAAPDSGAVHRWRDEGLRLWRREMARAVAETASGVTEGLATGAGAERGRTPWTPPEPTVLGRLQASLADVLVRDAVMLGFIEGTDRVGDRVIAGEGGAEVGQALRVIIDPVHGTAPDQDRVVGAGHLLHAVITHSTRSSQAPALTLLAVLAWWQGDGARAGILVDRALRADADHRLAALIGEALASGMPPGWLREQDSDRTRGLGAPERPVR